eukprot:4054777-Amphidinium_carterae.1
MLCTCHHGFQKFWSSDELYSSDLWKEVGRFVGVGWHKPTQRTYHVDRNGGKLQAVVGRMTVTQCSRKENGITTTNPPPSSQKTDGFCPSCLAASLQFIVRSWQNEVSQKFPFCELFSMLPVILQRGRVSVTATAPCPTVCKDQEKASDADARKASQLVENVAAAGSLSRF